LVLPGSRACRWSLRSRSSPRSATSSLQLATDASLAAKRQGSFAHAPGGSASLSLRLMTGMTSWKGQPYLRSRVSVEPHLGYGGADVSSSSKAPIAVLWQRRLLSLGREQHGALVRRVSSRTTWPTGTRHPDPTAGQIPSRSRLAGRGGPLHDDSELERSLGDRCPRQLGVACCHM